MSEAGTPQEENNYLSLPEGAGSNSAEPTDASAEITPATDASNNPHPSPEGIATAEEPLQRAEVVSIIKTWSPPPEPESPSATTIDTTSRRSKQEAMSSSAEVANFMALTHELRQRNRELLNRSNQLEQVLSECKEALHSQLAKSQAQEALLTQTTQELNHSQEQASRLFRELEASHQAAQRQQILIETLTEQLEGSQERIAQLERECTSIQQRYSEQSHQLIQSENTARELRSRLQRQQRQTLQFKAALEKCFEVPVLKEEIENIKEELSPVSPQEGKSSRAERPRSLSPIPKAQPIQPWSAQNELLQPESSPNWENPVSPLSPSPLDFFDWDVFDEQESDATLSESVYDDSAEFDLEDNLDAAIPFSDADSELEKQSAAEALFQMLDELESILPPPTTQSETPLELLTVEELAFPSPIHSAEEFIEEAETASAEERLEETATPSPLNVTPQPSFILQSVNLLPAGNEGDREEDEPETIQEFSPWEEETAEAQPAAFRPQERIETILSQPNWPSPVVYPLRPPKGRKSLASIELPTFPRRGG